MKNSNTNNSSLPFEDGISIQILKDLDLNLNIVNTTHSIRNLKKISFEFRVYFTYREISVLKDIYKNITNQFNIDQIKESSQINKVFDFSAKAKYLNKIPLFPLQNDKFGPYGNKISNVKINTILGDKYVLNPKINIFIYDYKLNKYKEYYVNSKTSWDDLLQICIEDLFTIPQLYDICT